MGKKVEPFLRVNITETGVKLVEFVGQGWDDEAGLQAIYSKIQPYIRRIDESLKLHGVQREIFTVH